MDKNTLIVEQTESPKKRSFWRSFLKGAGGFAVFDIAVDAFAQLLPKRWNLGSIIHERPLSRFAWISGFGLIYAAFLDKEHKKPAVQHVLSPQNPAMPRPELTLPRVPLILDQLVADGKLTAAQQSQVLAEIQSGQKKGFAGEIAVTDGFVSKTDLDTALGNQAMLKAKAAVADIQNIKDHGALSSTASFTGNWGNNGVNPPIAAPTRNDGAAAAANIAQNLVVLANADPFLAGTQTIEDGIRAACRLTTGINIGDSGLTPIKKMGDAWRATMKLALEQAARNNPQALTDRQGKPIDINAYIAARDSEITAAIQQTLAQQPGKDAGQSR